MDSGIKILKSDLMIQVTADYSQFKLMNGNRAISGKRVKKIEDSIRLVGFVPAPIVVNEKMEIIDGQGRFMALKKLGMPIYYIVVPGTGLQECIAMNISNTNWKLIDYIKSFADYGDINYIRLSKLIDDHSGIGIDNILTAATGHIDNKSKGLKEGTFKLSEADCIHADEVLNYLDRFIPIFKQRKIRNSPKLLNALCFTYEIQSIDNERMYKALNDYYLMLGGYSSTEQALESLTNVYNYRLRNKVFIIDEYKRYMSTRISWYEGKYGKLAS